MDGTGRAFSKRRILNFRITEDEYRCLQQASAVHGARSISDYARSILLEALGPNHGSQNALQISDRLAELEHRVSGIAEALHTLQQ